MSYQEEATLNSQVARMPYAQPYPRNERAVGKFGGFELNDSIPSKSGLRFLLFSLQGYNRRSWPSEGGQGRQFFAPQSNEEGGGRQPPRQLANGDRCLGEKDK